MKRILIAIGLLLGAAVILDHPDTAKAKIHSGGQIATSLTEEGGNVLNEGLGQVQGFGTPPTDTTPTTASAVGDGRP